MKEVIESTNLEKQLTRHHEGDSDYTHQGTGSSKKVLIAAVCLTLGYAVIEVIGGFLSNSLALLSDAGHMVTDSASLFFALLANVLAGRPASGKYSFGFAKLEVLDAFPRPEEHQHAGSAPACHGRLARICGRDHGWYRDLLRRSGHC